MRPEIKILVTKALKLTDVPNYEVFLTLSPSALVMTINKYGTEDYSTVIMFDHEPEGLIKEAMYVLDEILFDHAIKSIEG